MDKMDKFDFKNDKQYQLFEKALQGQDVSELLREIQEEMSFESDDEFENRMPRRGRKSGRMDFNSGGWDWMDPEERWEAMENAGYDPDEYN